MVLSIDRLIHANISCFFFVNMPKESVHLIDKICIKNFQFLPSCLNCSYDPFVLELPTFTLLVDDGGPMGHWLWVAVRSICKTKCISICHRGMYV